MATSRSRVRSVSGPASPWRSRACPKAGLRSRRRRFERKPQRERASNTRRAGEGDFPAERASQPAADRQPDARSRRRVWIESRELAEHQGLLLERNSRPIVRDRYGRPASSPWRITGAGDARRNRDASIRMREFHRVRHQVRQDLAHALDIRLDDERVVARWNERYQAETPRRCGSAKFFDDRNSRRADIHAFTFDVELPGLRAFSVEEAGDEIQRGANGPSRATDGLRLSPGHVAVYAHFHE